MNRIQRHASRLAACATLLLAACGGAEDGGAPAALAMAGVDDPTPVADTMVVYKTATCGCCKDWIEHMEQNGFTVVARDLAIVELNRLNQDVGLPTDLVSCHTGVIAGYTVEGHVPADLVKRMLRERPPIAGIAVPGMPVGSPGMEGAFKQDYDVIAYRRDGTREVYAKR